MRRRHSLAHTNKVALVLLAMLPSAALAQPRPTSTDSLVHEFNALWDRNDVKGMLDNLQDDAFFKSQYQLRYSRDTMAKTVLVTNPPAFRNLRTQELFNELHQIGLTLRARQGEYYVTAIATRLGNPAVSGVVVGDKLVRVGDLATRGATLGQIYSAMHGAPGERRVIVIERDGRSVRIEAPITAF